LSVVAAGSAMATWQEGGASAQLQIELPAVVGGTASLVATVASDAAAPSALVPVTHHAIMNAVADARARLMARFTKYAAHNETFAGMQTSISWNVVSHHTRASSRRSSVALHGLSRGRTTTCCLSGTRTSRPCSPLSSIRGRPSQTSSVQSEATRTGVARATL
jgi:hypothetical protein